MLSCRTLQYLKSCQCFIKVCWINDISKCLSKYNLLSGETATHCYLLEEELLPLSPLWYYFFTDRLERKLTAGDSNNIEIASITSQCVCSYLWTVWSYWVPWWSVFLWRLSEEMDIWLSSARKMKLDKKQ